MITRQDVLEYIEDLAELGGALTAGGLAKRFRLTSKAAERHVYRLLGERLIAVKAGARDRFVLTARGRDRLAWHRGYDAQQATIEFR